MNGNQPLGPARLLLGDAMLVFLILNEVRHRSVARLFGVSRKDSNLTSVFAIASLVGVVAAAGARVRAIHVRPTSAETPMGIAVAKEAVHGIAGEWSRVTPSFAGLVGLVVLERSFGPSLRAAARALRGALRDVARSLRSLRGLLEG